MDFSPLTDKLVRKEHWLQEEAEQACLQYRRYLILVAKYHDQYPELPPSEDIDQFWHMHILDTTRYGKDCESIFGFFLHHYPYLGMDGKTTENDVDHAFANTTRLYYQEFGEHLTNARFKPWQRALIRFAGLVDRYTGKLKQYCFKLFTKNRHAHAK